MMTPAVVRLRNLLRFDAVDETSVEAARKETLRLLRWADWVEPLLRTLDLEAGPELVAALEGQMKALQGEVEVLPEATDRAALASARAQVLLGFLPAFSRVPIINEVLCIGSAVLRKCVDKESLAGRLPVLWLEVRRLEELEGQPLQGLREGVGGLAVYLEQGRNRDLATALTLLGLHSRGPLCVDAPPRADHEEAARLCRQLLHVRRHSFLPARLHELHVRPLEQSLSGLASQLLQHRQTQRQQTSVVETSLRQLEQAYASRPSFQAAPRFATLLDLMEAVFLRRAPDDWLEQMVEAVESTLLDLLPEASPEVEWQALLLQRTALATLRAYLEENPDRMMLLTAYEELCQPIQRLIELQTSSPVMDVFDTGETYDQMGMTAGGAAESFAAVASLLSHYREGRLEADSLRNALEPFERTLDLVEEQLGTSECDDELSLLVSYTRDTLQDVFQGSQGPDFDQLEADLLELGRHLQRFRSDLAVERSS